MHRAADKEAARKRDQSKAKSGAGSFKVRLAADDATDGAEGERRRRNARGELVRPLEPRPGFARRPGIIRNSSAWAQRR